MTSEASPAPRGGRRFRSFKTKLMWLVALAVSVPAVSTCTFLGFQLDRQARTLFANGLSAHLETFSLVLGGVEQNLFEGVRRAAADNTLQITLDLDIAAQLTKYIEAQRQVMNIDFLGVYDRNVNSIAASGIDNAASRRQWSLDGENATAGAECETFTGGRKAARQLQRHCLSGLGRTGVPGARYRPRRRQRSIQGKLLDRLLARGNRGGQPRAGFIAAKPPNRPPADLVWRHSRLCEHSSGNARATPHHRRIGQ